jgi:hypothetical protein
MQSGGGYYAQNMLIPYQSGGSLGSWIMRSVKFLQPYLAPIVSSLADEALVGTKNVINNINDQGLNSWRDILKSQGQKSLQNLSNQAKDGILEKINQMQLQKQQSGSGIAKSRRKRIKSLTAVARRKKSTKKKSKPKKRSVSFIVSRKKRRTRSKISAKVLYK